MTTKVTWGQASKEPIWEQCYSSKDPRAQVPHLGEFLHHSSYLHSRINRLPKRLLKSQGVNAVTESDQHGLSNVPQSYWQSRVLPALVS